MKLNFIKSKKLNRAIINLVAVGFISILGQVIILRELVVAFYGIELIYILALVIWLLGTAVGASAGRKSSLPKENKINILFLFTGAVLLVEIIFIRGVRNIFGGVAGGYLPFTTQMIGLVIAILPVSLMMGLLFQQCAKIFVNRDETLAKAYSIESFGGIFGGLASTIFLSAGIQNFLAALLCILSITLLLSFNTKREKRSTQKYLFAAAVLFVIVLIGFNSRINFWMTSWNHPSLIESKDTPYNRTTVTKNDEQICVFEDDALSYETESISAEEFIQLSSLQANKLDRVLVLGGGFQGIVSELLKLPIGKIDYIEINNYLIDLLKKHLPDSQQFTINKKVNLIYDDPREYLDKDNLYDAIFIGMPEPSSAQNNRFYTKEFFQQCAKRLEREGVLAFKIPSSENIWTNQLLKRNRSIYKALIAEYDNVIVLPGVTNIFTASKSKLITDPKILSEKFEERKLQTKLVSSQYINYIFKNDRYLSVQKMLSMGNEAENSDLHPVCYSFTISIWLSKFFPELAQLDKNIFETGNVVKSFSFWMALTIILIIVFILRKRRSIRQVILVTVAGFVGMVLESLLILNYQSRNGNLFQDIGILLTMFMAGLSVGAYLINKSFESKLQREKDKSRFGTLLILSFAVVIALNYFFVKYDFLNSLLMTSLTLLLNGIFVSAIFAYVSLSKVENQNEIISKLYPADLIGGCIGSFAAALILIPGYGILTTIILMVAVTLFGIIFL